MTNPRVAVFVPDLRGGGAERVMLNLAIGFADAGYPVDLLVAVARGPYLKQVPSTVNLVDLKAKDVALSLPHVVRYLKSSRPTAMISALNQANVSAVLARRLSKVNTRILLTTHTFLTVERKNSRSLKLMVMPYFVRTFFPGADILAGVSREVSDDLARMLKLPTGRVRVLHNPVVSDSILEQAAASVEHPWFRPGQPPVLLTVGRLHHAKDHANLLNAFAELRSRRTARLIILGEGDLRAELEQQVARLNIGDDVSMPGFVENPYAYMSKAAAFVLSSRFEALPTVIIEAMACGLPVVSTDCPSGPSEILHGGKYGALVPVGDPSALAAAMQRQLDLGSPPPPTESWEAYRIPVVVRRYLEALDIVSSTSTYS